MEILFSIENFQDDGVARTINSPRSLEACLRTGFDPSELIARPKSYFYDKSLTKEMIDIRYNTYETKRRGKINLVKQERELIIQGVDKQRMSRSPDKSPEKVVTGAPFDRVLNMQEMEEKRVRKLKQRQEKELSKIFEKEESLAKLQKKIQDAEREEKKKKKLHDKKVAEAKAISEKKKTQRLMELKKQEEEELAKKRLMDKKEAAFDAKRRKAALEAERRMKREARQREIERAQKLEQFRQKTEAAIQSQMDLAEKNRLKMTEREEKIQQQLQAKKESKSEEIKKRQEEAEKKFMDTFHKNEMAIQEKRTKFEERQHKAMDKAKEVEIAQKELLKKQAEEREVRNKQRLNRLIESYKNREMFRKTIVQHRSKKDKVYDRVREARDNELRMQKFKTSLVQDDKLDNVDRVARISEYQRLQTLRKIREHDLRYEELKEKRKEYAKKHLEELKDSLLRKHEINDVMFAMRVSNDFSLLDKLNSKRELTDKKVLGDDGDGEDRLVHTA